MKLAALAIAVALMPSAAFARFAPPEGKPFRYSLVEERDGNRFTTERRVVFRKTTDGYAADLSVVSADATGDARVAAVAQRVPRALMGRTIRYRLDDEGHVVAVEDQAALIALVANAFTAMATDMANKAAVAIRAMPEERQRGLLVSLLQPMAMADRADASPGEQAVMVPAASPLGQAVTLAGRETVSRDSSGRTTIETVAQGSTGPGAPMVRMTTRQTIDSATGLLVSSDRLTESWMPGSPEKRSVIKTVSTISPVS